MNTKEFVQDAVGRSLVKYDERFSTVATSGSYNDLSDKPTIPPAYDDTAVQTALADRYTKTETDGKIAEAIADVNVEHFHTVTVLPPVAEAKENHEYVLVTYEQDGTTIASEEHYLFYDGVFHSRPTKISLDGYATEEYVTNALPTIDAVMDATSENPVQNKVVLAAIGDAVDVVDTAVQGLDTRVTAAETALVGKADASSLATVATSGDYDDLTNKPTIPAAYDDTVIQAAVAAKQDKITGGTSAQVLMKNSATEGDFNWQTLVGSGWGVAGTGSATAPSINANSTYTNFNVDVSSYGFVSGNDYTVCVNGGTNLSQIVLGGKSPTYFTLQHQKNGSNNEVAPSCIAHYVIIAKGYGTANAGNVPVGGTTGQALVKESDADGDFGWANFPEAYDDTALAARVTAVEDGKASLQIAAIPGGGGGEEINAAVSQGENSVLINYYKDSELPNTLNLNVDSDHFTIPTTAYADFKAAEAQNNAQVYTDLKLTQKQDTLVSGTNIKTINGESILGNGNVSVSQMPSYIVDKPEGNNAQLGNVVQVGTLQDVGGGEVGIFEFFYRTSALPDNTTTEYTLLPLLQDYNIVDFIDGTGVTSNGIFIGNGRTDGTNYVIIQQFSKNRKAVILRTYQDYTTQTALLKIKFLGTKITP